MDKCPECHLPFSDWFVWNGYRYCYPCWAMTGHRIVILENGEIKEDPNYFLKIPLDPGAR